MGISTYTYNLSVPSFCITKNNQIEFYSIENYIIPIPRNYEKNKVLL